MVTCMYMRIGEGRDVQNGSGPGLASPFHIMEHRENICPAVDKQTVPWGTALDFRAVQRAEGSTSPFTLNSFFAHHLGTLLRALAWFSSWIQIL